jgi:hypothetical protein
MNTIGVTTADIERALACVRDHPRATALSAFAYAVLASQAAQRVASVGTGELEAAAKEHGIDRMIADTSLGNVVAILERGPRDAQENALIGGFAATGFSEVCLAAGSGERRAAARALIEHLDWIELATPYRITPLLGLVLPGEIRGIVEDVLLESVLANDAATEDPNAPDSSERAQNIARVTRLARVQHDAALAALVRIAELAKDPATRAVSRAMLGETAKVGVEAAAPLRVHGLASAPARRAPFAILRWVTGIALLSALYRALCFVIALRREAEIELDGGILRVRGRTTFLGRTVRSHEACYTVDRISGAFRRARFALLGSAVGVISLSCGILLGGHLLFDGSRGGAPILLIAGAVAVLIGAALDLALEILIPARAGQVEVQVDVLGARSVRLSRVSLPDADRLLAALSQRVAR